MIYQTILANAGKKRVLAILVDPDKTGPDRLPLLLKYANDSGVSFIFLGGSLVNRPVDPVIMAIRKYSRLPVVIFPGSRDQLSDKADGLLLLSLISGRNPEFLIGNHVLAAKSLRESPLEIIPTGYMLIQNGSISSVEYISNTKPLPRDKPEIAVSTAIAGELLGLKLIYMEGGSGAAGVLPGEMISSVKKNINIPLVVGGGIQSASDLKSIYDSGADIAVVGNAIENDPGKLKELSEVLK
jgi:phosphoglycerol geranylgeranyltransferase